MILLVMVVVYVIMQYGLNFHWLQQDQWYHHWCRMNRGLPSVGSELMTVLQVVPPVLAVFLLFVGLDRLSHWLVPLASIPVLLYSLGREEITGAIQAYLADHRRGDSVAAAQVATEVGVNFDDDGTDNWSTLHGKFLAQAAYSGFERLFAVLFWFVVLGPAAALMYRLACLSRDSEDNPDGVRLAASRLVWLLEWPAVRVLGFSFALTGNFVGCFHLIKENFPKTNTGTAEILYNFVIGALNLNNQDTQPEAITDREIEALVPLLSRTMVLWLCVVAFATLLT